MSPLLDLDVVLDDNRMNVVIYFKSHIFKEQPHQVDDLRWESEATISKHLEVHLPFTKSTESTKRPSEIYLKRF